MARDQKRRGHLVKVLDAERRAHEVLPLVAPVGERYGLSQHSIWGELCVDVEVTMTQVWRLSPLNRYTR